MIKRLFFSMLIFSLLCVSSATAAMDITLLDKDFIRDQGTPITETHTFTGFAGTAIINIYNGAQNDSETGKKASSSLIKVNGVDVFGTSDFNQNVASLTAQINLNEGDNTIAVQLMGKPGGRIRVEIVQEVEGSFSVPSDPNKIIDDDGTRYLSNEILIVFSNATTQDVINEIVSSVGGSIVGYCSSVKLYQIRVANVSIEELNNIINTLKTNNHVEIILRNYIANLNEVENDLSILEKENQDDDDLRDRLLPYSMINLKEAYDALDSSTFVEHQSFQNVTIGILDTGVNINHQEFIGVRTNRTPQEAIIDQYKNGEGAHGTCVAGIIGANNISAKGNPFSSNEMNGIISGIPDETAANGSMIPYTLQIQSYGSNVGTTIESVFKSVYLIEQLADSKVDVINFSAGWADKSKVNVDGNGKIKSDDFAAAEILMKRTIEHHDDILFVVSAGNFDCPVDFITPANIDADNVISVGATMTFYFENMPNNVRADFSCFGEGVDIYAPGVKVYAPTFYDEESRESQYHYGENDNGFSGTSASAPMVTGVAGLLLSTMDMDDSNKPAKVAKVRDIIISSGVKINIEEDGEIKERKFLNALNAVKMVLSEYNLVSFEFSGHITESYDDDYYVFGIKEGDAFSGIVTYEIGASADLDNDTTVGIYPCPYETCGESWNYCNNDKPLVNNNKLEVTLHGERGDFTISTCSNAFIRNQRYDFIRIGGHWEKEDRWGKSINELSIQFWGSENTIDNDDLPDQINLPDWGSASLSMSMDREELVCVDVPDEYGGDCFEYDWILFEKVFEINGQIEYLNMIK